MSSKSIIPQLVLLRKGKLPVVFVQLQSLENAHPNLTVGEMEAALDNPAFNRQAFEAIKEKECNSRD
jgi:hypothetical protein